MAMAENSPQDILDPLDLMLIKELEVDARQSYAALAAKLSTTHMTVYRRLQRLLNKRLITLTTIADPTPLGYKIEAAIAINVQIGKVDEVANQLAAFGNVSVVMVTVGRYDIIAWITTRDHEELLDFSSKALARIRGITNAETLMSIKNVKHLWEYFTTEKSFQVKGARDHVLDELDLMLIRELEAEPRESVAHLARKIGVSPSGVTRRLQTLRREGFIKIVSIAHPAALGYRIRAVIFFKVDPAKTIVTAERLAQYPNVMHMVIATGRFDIIAWTVFKDERHMADFLINELGTHDSEIIRYETAIILKTPKVSYTVLSRNDRDQL